MKTNIANEMPSSVDMTQSPSPSINKVSRAQALVSEEDIQQYFDEGYLVVRGLLDVERDVEAFRDSHFRYLDDLADILIAETNPDLYEGFAERPFGERFAILHGCGSGELIDHIDPSLACTKPGYKRRSDLPSAQTPELFRIMRNETLLDAIECLIGPEISTSAGFRVNLKLAQKHLDLAFATAQACGLDSPDHHDFWGLLVGAATIWHSDAAYALAGARRNNAVTAWIPITESTLENGCLLVVPGSHRDVLLFDPIPPSARAKAIPLTASPGDVVFFHYRLLHGSLRNTTEDQIRMALNFRYSQIGEPHGIVHLPSIVARSRAAPERELHDPDLWRRMWECALDYSAMHVPMRRPAREIGEAEAEALRAHWRAMAPNHADWLNLDPDLKSPIADH